MNCQKCGSYMNDNQTLCPYCGSTNPNVNQQQYQQPQYQQSYQTNTYSQLPMN